MSIEDASRCVEGSIELYIELYIEDVEARAQGELRRPMGALLLPSSRLVTRAGSLPRERIPS